MLKLSKIALYVLVIYELYSIRILHFYFEINYSFSSIFIFVKCAKHRIWTLSFSINNHTNYNFENNYYYWQNRIFCEAIVKRYVGYTEESLLLRY